MIVINQVIPIIHSMLTTDFVMLLMLPFAFAMLIIIIEVIKNICTI